MNRLSSIVYKLSVVLVVAPIVLGVAVALEGPACGSDSARPPTSAELGLPSPEALATDLLDQFEAVYNRRDGEAYAAMFDPWVFSYEFSPQDERWGGPAAWDYALEIQSAQRMFADPKTTMVSLELTREDFSAASRSDAVPVDTDGVWKVTAAVYLDVERETADGGTKHHHVRGQLHEFYFRRGTEDEGRAWRIVYWRDTTGRERVFTARY